MHDEKCMMRNINHSLQFGRGDWCSSGGSKHFPTDLVPVLPFATALGPHGGPMPLQLGKSWNERPKKSHTKSHPEQNRVQNLISSDLVSGTSWQLTLDCPSAKNKTISRQEISNSFEENVY
jgi:hypothetical protein